MTTFNELETQQSIEEFSHEAYRAIDGKLERITDEEFQEEMRKSQEVQQKMKSAKAVEQDSDPERAGRIVSVTYRQEEGNFYLENLPKKVSAVINGGKDGGSITATTAVTREAGVNIGVDFSLRQIGGLNFGFSLSESWTTEVGHTINVGKRKKAYMVFYPRMYYSRGTAEICREIRQGHGHIEVVCQDRHNCTLHLPVSISPGFLDGLYDLKYVK